MGQHGDRPKVPLFYSGFMTETTPSKPGRPPNPLTTLETTVTNMRLYPYRNLAQYMGLRPRRNVDRVLRHSGGLGLMLKLTN
jgi:hypothetical protein